MSFETKKNSIEFKLWGRYALFTDPITKLGGEKCSYQIPTYEAIKGVLKSIYWKPTFTWVVDKVRVINQIQTQTKGIKPLNWTGSGSGRNSLAYYTYLSDVCYQVQAHFEWNNNRPELANDRIDGKHFEIARRSLEKGGRQDIFLGARECQGYVEPMTFGSSDGAYDGINELSFGIMFHGFDYPDEYEGKELRSRFWRSIMNKGVIEYPAPQECSMVKIIREIPVKQFNIGENILSSENEEAVL